jgi:hypothetical protein
MAVSQAELGYATQIGRQAANLTTIALAITGSTTPQAVTPASMTSIAVGTLLVIDTGNLGVKEVVQVTAAPGPTFTAIFLNSHGTSISIALMVPIIELVKVAGPLMKSDIKEVSNMGSPNIYKEFIAGLRDGGTVTFEGNYLPKEATLSQQTLRTDFEGGIVSYWCINPGGGPAGTGIWTFTALVQDIAPSYPVDDRITFTATLKITGKPVLF